MIKINNLDEALALLNKPIWFVRKKEIICPRCKGAGYVSAIYADTGESTEVDCPVCRDINGDHIGSYEQRADSFKLQNVAVQYLDSGEIKASLRFEANATNFYNFPIIEKNYYLTEPEAQAEADRRNREAGK